MSNNNWWKYDTFADNKTPCTSDTNLLTEIEWLDGGGIYILPDEALNFGSISIDEKVIVEEVDRFIYNFTNNK